MKALFLESLSFYKNLGVNTDFSSIEVEFDGLKYYKNTPDFFSEYDLVVSVLYHSPLANYVIQKANEANTKTVLLLDGVFDWANVTINSVVKSTGCMTFHPVVHDVFLVIGEEEKRYFESRLVQSLKFLPGRILIPCARLPLPLESKVLITTANTAYFNNDERDILVSMLFEVIERLKEQKIPLIYRVFDSALIDMLEIGSLDNYVNCSYEEVLSLCTCVVTTPSSVALSSMYHHRAVGLLVFRDTPMFLQSGWNFLRGSDFKEEVASLITMDEARMGYQNFVVDKYIDNALVDLEEALIESVKLKKQAFVNKNYEILLDSPFNFNLEYFSRKILFFLKKVKFMRGFLKELKKKFL